MGSPRAPGAADRLLRSRAPRAKRLADERRAFGAPTDFVTPTRLKRFASLSKRARRSITSFSRPRSRSLSSSRVVIVDERSLSLSLSLARVNPKKDTEDDDGTTRTVSVVPRRDALTSRRTADRSRATEFDRAWRYIRRRRRRARARVAPSRRTSRRASRGSTRRVTTRRRSSRFSWR